jgi:hypothetical protein
MPDTRPDDGTPLPGDSRLTPPERDPGRPTGTTDEDGLRAGRPQDATPTVAPEERGATPEIEHAPGGDL